MRGVPGNGHPYRDRSGITALPLTNGDSRLSKNSIAVSIASLLFLIQISVTSKQAEERTTGFNGSSAFPISLIDF